MALLVSNFIRVGKPPSRAWSGAASGRAVVRCDTSWNRRRLPARAAANPVASSGCSEPSQRAQSGGLEGPRTSGLRYVLIPREIVAALNRPGSRSRAGGRAQARP